MYNSQIKMFITFGDRPSYMSNPAETQQSTRPGLKAGRSNEFAFILPLNPGGAERMRKKMSDTYKARDQSETGRIGTIHDMRFVIFDNDTRLLFASTFDGDWLYKQQEKEMLNLRY
jgi:hypothetical protein